MTVLFASSNYDGFQLSEISAFQEDTAGSARDVNFSPASMLFFNTTLTATALLSAATVNATWAHATLQLQALGSAAVNPILNFINASGVIIYRVVNGDGVNPNVFSIQRLVSGSYVTLCTTPVIGSAERSNWDFSVFSDATNGRVAIYRNGTLDAVFNGNTTTDSTFGISRISIPKFTFSGNFLFVSEFIVADEATLGWRLEQENANAAGTNTNFTGSFTDIDETLLNTADKISSDTNNASFTAGYEDPTQLASRVIKAVVVASTVQNSVASTLGNAEHLIRIGTTNYAGPVMPVSKTATLVGINNVFSVNPATGLVWTSADINAAQFGIRVTT